MIGEHVFHWTPAAGNEVEHSAMRVTGQPWPSDFPLPSGLSRSTLFHFIPGCHFSVKDTL